MTTQATETNVTESRGRKPIFEDKKKLGAILVSIRDKSAPLTHYMKHQLAEKGYRTLKRVGPPSGGRGRPTEEPELTGKARQEIGRQAGLATQAQRRQMA